MTEPEAREEAAPGAQPAGLNQADPVAPHLQGASTPDVAADEEIVHADGSRVRASTQNGILEHDDVANSPLLQGTDPLGDEAIERRQGGRISSQGIIFVGIALVIAGFFISDLVHGEWGRAVLGAVVLAICGAAIVREVQSRKR